MKLQTNYPLIDTIRKAKRFYTPDSLAGKVLLFIPIMLIAMLIEGSVIAVRIMPSLTQWMEEQTQAKGNVPFQQLYEKVLNMTLEPTNMRIILYTTSLGTLSILFFCRQIEGRRFRTMGFKKEGAVKQYLIGMLSGFTIFSCIVLVSFLMGGLEWNGYQGGAIGAILIMLFGFLLQGMSEEVIFRGYCMTTILRHHHLYWAIAFNAFFFGIMHAFNNGFTLFALFNLMLYGVMSSLYVLRTDNLWGVCALHGVWNFVQGNFYGLPVSGVDSGDKVFAMSLKGADILNGGAFGLEASLATTIVLLIAIAILLFVPLPFCVNGQKTTEETEQTP